MSESMGKETKQNSSKSDKKNINHIDNSIESQTGRPGSILEIKDLCFAYPEEEKRALNHISFQIKEGEFLVLCGKSGCGKSTLLKHMKTPLTPHGKRKGEILFDGKNLHEMTGREQSQRIGYVLQNPDNQIVTDKVWHELAFGLESLGYKSAEIRIRVAEMASYFGIQDWFYKNVAELSGGQKQLLNLASIMAMHPDILILDEPTSQLDPIAASDFLGSDPSACAKIPKNCGGIFLRGFPSGDLLPNIFRFYGICAILKIQDQCTSGICFIQNGNFL